MRKIFLSMTILMISLLFITGCGETVEEEIADGILDNNLDDYELNLEEDQNWPDYVPSCVPKFKDGEVFSAIKMDTDMVITINYNDDKYLDNYIDEYDNGDWTKISGFIDTESNKIFATYSNDDYIVTLVSNVLQVTISVTTNY